MNPILNKNIIVILKNNNNPVIALESASEEETTITIAKNKINVRVTENFNIKTNYSVDAKNITSIEIKWVV